ncbi:hypothetical protein HORIV_33400 [Vreelandella olivaria]|uniref:TGS domain-containing protein n=1 Tax=Vreelandella olivaria TaxID=390919 RepID=A0ABN5WVD3_9GAMM|nr:hypothetical protein HORIV_33400 [Halomonas olivaria]
MPIVTLPDGSQRTFEAPLTIMQLAESIGPGLAKACIAGKIDGVLVDAADLIEQDAEVSIITARDAEGLEIIRHSCAHLIGHAVKQMYPEAKMAIGPVIEDGFYYDVEFGQSVTPEDLEAIEARMQSLIEREYDVVREYVDRDKAMLTFCTVMSLISRRLCAIFLMMRRSGFIIMKSMSTCAAGRTCPILAT